MNKLLVMAVLGFLLINFQPVSAFAEDSYKIAASHGGQVSKAGSNFVELVAKDGELMLYVTDDKNNKVSTEGGQAKATIRYGKNRETISIDMKFVQENTLKGSGEFQIKPDTTIVIFIKLYGQDAYGSRFSLNKSDETEESGHHHHDDHDHHMSH